MADGNMYLRANNIYQFALKVKSTDVDYKDCISLDRKYNLAINTMSRIEEVIQSAIN